jgi:hypothetical protein
MDLISTQPSINLPAFLHVMAASLAELHAAQRAHGGIKDGQWQNWLSEDGRTLSKERFIQAAAPQVPAPQDEINSDIHSFAFFSIGLICQQQNCGNQPFLADVYMGKEWPDVFLRLLQSISTQGGQTCVTMEALCSALEPPKALSEPVEVADNLPAETPPEAVSPLVKVAVPSYAKVPPPPPVISFALPNATVGKPYSLEPGRIAMAIAKQRGDNEESASVAHLQLPEDCGCQRHTDTRF